MHAQGIVEMRTALLGHAHAVIGCPPRFKMEEEDAVAASASHRD